MYTCVAWLSDSGGASWIRAQNKIIVYKSLEGLRNKRENCYLGTQLGKVGRTPKSKLIKIHKSLPVLKAVTYFSFLIILFIPVLNVACKQVSRWRAYYHEVAEPLWCTQIHLLSFCGLPHVSQMQNWKREENTEASLENVFSPTFSWELILFSC